MSLRRIAQESALLDPPESIHHSNLSETLRMKEGRNMYLQTFLAICAILHRTPESVLFGERAALLGHAFGALSPQSQRGIIQRTLELLDEEGASAVLRERLRQQT